MIRFLLTIFLISLLYLGFGFINQYDSALSVSFLDYRLTTSAFFLVVTIFFGYAIFAVILKAISLILSIPSALSNKMKDSRSQNINRDLLDCYSFAITGDEDALRRVSARIKNQLPSELSKHLSLILSTADYDHEQKAYHLRYLLENNSYPAFASLELAKYFLRHKYYKQGLEYAQKYLHFGSEDQEILCILTEIYGELRLWDGFNAAVRKLKDFDCKIDENLSCKISGYFLVAAKDCLSIGSDSEAMEYLENGLLYKAYDIEILDLICSLNVNRGYIEKNRQLLESVFASNPSFEIFEVYFRSVNMPASEIYSSLSSLADPRKHIGLFIGIAAFLDLDDTVEFLKQLTKEV
jgi:hypothetical protein